MLINPAVQVYLRTPSIPLGLISIGSYLRAHGDDVAFIERSVDTCNIVEEVKKFQPQVVGISCMSFLACLDAKKLTKEIRQISSAPIIWGGHAPSSLPELCLREGQPDYLSLGEGEITIYEFVRAVETGGDFSRIKGLAWLDPEGSLVRTPDRPLTDLTTLPDMDWSFIEPQKYFSAFFHCTKMLYVYSSKGCTEHCTFCSNKNFHHGRNVCRDPRQVMHDIEYLVGQCGANGIYFSDELFMPNRKLRNELMDMIIDSGLDFAWGCQMRLGVLNFDDIDYMYKAGCRWILFGIESGDPDVFKSIKKRIDPQLAEPTIAYCEKVGMTVQASFIIGFPGETPEQMKRTIDFALSLSATLPVVNVLMPMPNSELYDHQLEVDPDFHVPETMKELADLETVMTDEPKVNLSNIPSRDLSVVHYFFQWKGFKRKDAVQEENFGIVKKLARDTYIRIFKHGLRGFFFGTYHSVMQFLTVWFYSHCFPKTRKRYGLKL